MRATIQDSQVTWHLKFYSSHTATLKDHKVKYKCRLLYHSLTSRFDWVNLTTVGCVWGDIRKRSIIICIYRNYNYRMKNDATGEPCITHASDSMRQAMHVAHTAWRKVAHTGRIKRYGQKIWQEKATCKLYHRQEDIRMDQTNRTWDYWLDSSGSYKHNNGNWYFITDMGMSSITKRFSALQT